MLNAELSFCLSKIKPMLLTPTETDSTLKVESGMSYGQKGHDSLLTFMCGYQMDYGGKTEIEQNTVLAGQLLCKQRHMARNQSAMFKLAWRTGLVGERAILSTQVQTPQIYKNQF